jgi:hypothetical protein
VKALKESHRDEKSYHDGIIDTLQREFQRIQNAMTQCMWASQMEKYHRNFLIEKVVNGAQNKQRSFVRLKCTRMRVSRT